MKRKNKVIALSLLGIFSFTQTGCLGSFGLTSGLKAWNESATDSRILNNLIFWVFLIVPVYEISLFIDVVILNLIEFWTGSNPTAMEEGEVETQIVEKDGITYLMKATRNNFKITALNGEKKDQTFHLTYNPEEKSWNKVEENGELTKMLQYNEKSSEVTLFKPSGETITLTNNAANFNTLKSQIKWESTYLWASAK